MASILAYVDLTLAGYIATFVATLFFSDRIKDFFRGVPSELRTGLKSVEAKLLADVKSYQAQAIAKLVPPSAPAAPEPPKAA